MRYFPSEVEIDIDIFILTDILIRWRIYIEECGLRGLCGQTRDFSLPEFKSKGRIDVGSFLNLADLIWGEFFSLFRFSLFDGEILYHACIDASHILSDIERTYEPHTFVQVPWIKDWFLAQVFAPNITDFGLETRHFKTGVAKDNPAPVVPDTVLAKLVVMLEAKLRRKKMKLVPLVPKKPSVEVIKKTSANKLKKRPSDLVFHSNSNQSQPQLSSSPSQNPDARQPNRLRKRSRSLTRNSPESIQHGVPVHVQTPGTPPAKDKDKWSNVRVNLGPPPSPSHGRRFDGPIGVPRRRSPEKVMLRPLQGGPPSPPLGRAKPSLKDWEII